ncbi:phosphoribosyltransferase [Caminibacter pacificus]|jgi:xanthine phosphoribosyltransferase
MNKYYYGYEEFLNDLDTLQNQIKDYNPDCLLAIARGGMTLGHFLAERMDTKELYSLNASSYENETKVSKPKIFNIPDLSHKKRVLLLDDISDSGETLDEVIKILKTKYPNIEIKSATIFYKENTIHKPDYVLKKADRWIVFFWDKEGQKIIEN